MIAPASHNGPVKTKLIHFSKTPGKAFDWDPIIDGGATLGSLLAPELAPYLMIGKSALKHFMKGEKKEKEHKHHKREGKFDEAFEGKAMERRLEPLTRQIVQKPRPEFVTAADGVKIPKAQFDQYLARVPLVGRKGERVIHQKHSAPWKDVAIQSNLRQIADHSVMTKVSDKNAPGKTIDDYARLNKVSQMTSKSIPVLQGDMGSAMDMHPVTITKTENHAIIAGSELLEDLVVPPGSGGAGNTVMQNLLNPRSFVGTRLEIESKEWLMFKFRKFILEYIPTIGSGTTGNFISYFTQDPNEENQNGIQARRNALEHSGAVPFQPFSYMVCGMTPAPKDENLYYISDNDANNDDRLMFQGMQRVVNNALNADETTVPTYGTITIHYECDYYFPAIAEQNAPAGPTDTDAVTVATAADAAINFQKTGGTWPDLPVTIGEVYQFNCGALVGALAASNTYFNTPFGTSPQDSGLVSGQMYYLSIFATSNTVANFRVYDQLSFASQFGTSGALYARNSILAGVVLEVKNLTKVSPNLVAEVRTLAKQNKIDLSESECDLININRRVRDLKTDELRFPVRSLETIGVQYPVTGTQLPAIHVTAKRPTN